MNRRVVAVALLVTAACSSSEPPAASPCAALCRRKDDCQRRVEESECARVCSETFAFWKLRPEAERNVTLCLDDRSCSSIRAGDAVAACVDASVRTPMSTSSAARALCDSAASTAERCLRSFDREQCFASTNIYVDETIAVVQRCLERPCGELDVCFRSALAVAPAPSR